MRESKACLSVFHQLLIMCLLINACEAVQRLFLALIDSDQVQSISLFNDFFQITLLTYFFALTKPRLSLNKFKPMGNLINQRLIFYFVFLYFTVSMMFFIQKIILFKNQTYKGQTEIIGEIEGTDEIFPENYFFLDQGYLNFITNLVTILCIVFHESYPYRQSFWSNHFLVLYIVLFFFYTLYNIFEFSLGYYWDYLYNRVFRKPFYNTEISTLMLYFMVLIWIICFFSLKIY